MLNKAKILMEKFVAIIASIIIKFFKKKLIAKMQKKKRIHKVISNKENSIIWEINYSKRDK
jgi:hypothetical protein